MVARLPTLVRCSTNTVILSLAVVITAAEELSGELDSVSRLCGHTSASELGGCSHEAVWDGRDSSGREVGSGSYLARLEFGGKVEVVRMGLVR